MITNLLANVIVSLVTNTSEEFPKRLVPVPSPGDEGVVHAVFHGRYEPVKNPQEKWVTTNIVEVTIFQFMHNGTPLEFRKEVSKTNWTTHFAIVPPEPLKWIATTNNPPKPISWF